MEILLKQRTKQRRVRFSGTQVSQEEPNKTQSFKTGNSGQMSRDYASSDDVEFATAIAAAVFAINSLQEAGSQNQNKMSEDLKTSSTMIKSRKEDSTIRLPDPGSNKDAKEDTQSPGEASMKKPEGLYGRMPSLKRIPTFGTPSTKPEHEVDTLRQSTSQRPGNAETMADVWEKAEMAKLQRWYERKILNLLSWEKHMREKSRRRVETTENEEKRRKALQYYNRKTAAIDRLVQKEKTNFNEKRRNKESKVKERANKIRSTGKLPVTCCCCYC